MTFDQNNPKSALQGGRSRWPFLMDDNGEDNTRGVRVVNSHEYKGCGRVTIGDADGCGSSRSSCYGCMQENYEDNVSVEPGQEVSTRKDNMPSDLDEDVCGIWVELKFLDNPVM